MFLSVTDSCVRIIRRKVRAICGIKSIVLEGMYSEPLSWRKPFRLYTGPDQWGAITLVAWILPDPYQDAGANMRSVLSWKMKEGIPISSGIMKKRRKSIEVSPPIIRARKFPGHIIYTVILHLIIFTKILCEMQYARINSCSIYSFSKLKEDGDDEKCLRNYRKRRKSPYKAL